MPCDYKIGVAETVVSDMNPDYSLEAYDFDLPERNIAQFPCREAGSSRLLILDKTGGESETGQLTDSMFANLPDLLPENALVIANNARVLPARIVWTRPSGGAGEFLLLTPLPLLEPIAGGDNLKSARVECLLRPSAKIKPGQKLHLAPGLICEVASKGEFGRHMVDLYWSGDLEKIFTQYGQPPLPPYIRRAPEDLDMRRYQTIFAQKTGAVAAPTAGLHFTQRILDRIHGKNIQWHEVTLHVGYGTFSPVRQGDIRQHEMHAEYAELDGQTAMAINQAKTEGRPVIAIGTTSLRVLEGIASMRGKISPFAGWINIFIYPGYQFKVVDAMITNFHLPKSSLLMLVSAFAGRKAILNAYQHAIEEDYKFFSYGDAMFIKRSL